MADKWSVINQRQTTINRPGIGLTPVMEVTVQLTTGETFTLDIPIAAYSAEAVKSAIEERAGHIAAVANLQMGNWWNPVDWVDWAERGAGSLAADIRNWTEHIVSAAIDLVNQGIDAVHGFVDDIYSWAQGAIGDIWNGIDDAWHYIDRVLTVDIPGWFDDALNTAQRWVNDAIDWAGQAIHDVWQAGMDFTNSVLDWAGKAIADVWDYFTSTLKGIVDWADQAIRDVIDWVNKEIAAPIFHALDWLTGQVSDLAQFVGNELTWAYHLVKSVAGWLEEIAKLPFESLHDFLWLLQGQLTLRNAKSGGDMVLAHLGDLEAGVAHVLS